MKAVTMSPHHEGDLPACNGLNHPHVSPFLGKEGGRGLYLRDTPFVRLTAALKLPAEGLRPR